MVGRIILLMLFCFIIGEMINKGNSQYFIGNRDIKQDFGSSQSYPIAKLFGEEVYKIKPWIFISEGNFPCVLYTIYFNIASQYRLMETQDIIKSIALFKGFIVYLTSKQIHLVKVLDNRLNKVKSSYIDKKYKVVKEISFGYEEDFIILSGENDTSYAHVNLDRLIIGDIKPLFQSELKQNTKVERHKNFAFIPSSNKGLHIIEHTNSELVYRGKILNETKIIDIAIILSESNAPKLILVNYPKHLMITHLNLKDFKTDIEVINVTGVFGIGCYKDESVNCLILAEDKIGYRELFELHYVNESYSLTMRQSSHDMLYLNIVNNTALAVGETSYLILKKSWSKYISIQRNTQAAISLDMANTSRLIEVHNHHIELTNIVEDYGNFYCSGKIPAGKYEFSLLGISSKCIEEDVIEGGNNCTYRMSIRFDVEAVFTTLYSKVFMLILIVFILIAIVCGVVIYKRRKDYESVEVRRYNGIKDGKIIELQDNSI